MITAFVQWVQWMATEHPTWLLLGGMALAWVSVKGVVTVIYGYWLYKRDAGWVPRPETQRRLQTAARGTGYAFHVVALVTGIVLAWFAVQRWHDPSLPVLVVGIVLVWTVLACLLKGAQRVLRMWADMSEPVLALERKPKQG